MFTLGRFCQNVRVRGHLRFFRRGIIGVVGSIKIPQIVIEDGFESESLYASAIISGDDF